MAAGFSRRYGDFIPPPFGRLNAETAARYHVFGEIAQLPAHLVRPRFRPNYTIMSADGELIVVQEPTSPEAPGLLGQGPNPFPPATTHRLGSLPEGASELPHLPSTYPRETVMARFPLPLPLDMQFERPESYTSRRHHDHHPSIRIERHVKGTYPRVGPMENDLTFERHYACRCHWEEEGHRCINEARWSFFNWVQKGCPYPTCKDYAIPLCAYHADQHYDDRHNPKIWLCVKECKLGDHFDYKEDRDTWAPLGANICSQDLHPAVYHPELGSIKEVIALLRLENATSLNVFPMPFDFVIPDGQPIRREPVVPAVF